MKMVKYEMIDLPEIAIIGKEAEKQRQFELKQQKRKEKHRGH